MISEKVKLLWSGVRQGIELGLVLFLVYINDLMDAVQSSNKLFADDAKLCRKIKTPADGEVLQEDITKLQEWSRKWLLQFNQEKRRVMHLGRRNPGYQYHIGDTPLTTTEEEKDLGVHVIPSLKPMVQVAKVAASANSTVGLLRKTYTYLDAEMYLLLYKSLVRSRLEYCIQAWSPYIWWDIWWDINKLDQVQQRVLFLLIMYPKRVATTELSPTCNATCFETLRNLVKGDK